jgi:hypothetical protein
MALPTIGAAVAGAARIAKAALAAPRIAQMIRAGKIAGRYAMNGLDVLGNAAMAASLFDLGQTPLSQDQDFYVRQKKPIGWD